jgi:UDPglucose 6-dehydrogenase
MIVPTPSGADGAFKNDHVLVAIEEIGRVLAHKQGYHLVVVNSTTMPGSVGGPIRDRLEVISGKRVGHDIGLCYNPEFIALGNVIEGLLRPDFVLIGESDARAGGLLEEICRCIVGPSVPVCRMNFVNAELTKISVNTYVTTKISFANMLSEICDKLSGADADVITQAIGRDGRTGLKYLRGATGYGGPCFPRDTIAFSTMAKRLGVDASLAGATHVINERQVERLVTIIAEHSEPGDRVAVLGLSYKPDTDVIERSQGVMLAAALGRIGRAVVAHDPLAIEPARAALGPGVSLAASPEEAVTSAAVVIVMVPWPEYKNFFASYIQRIRATTDWATAIGETDITYVIVPTPSGADGAFKNDHVLVAIEEIGRRLAHKQGYHLVVVNSTTMPGSVGGPIRDRLEVISSKRVGHDMPSATSSRDRCGPTLC